MGLAIDYGNQIVQITSPTTSVDAQALHDFIEDSMATPEGMQHSAIIQPEGKIEDPSNPGIFSQIIIVLNTPWQIQFWGGSGYTRIFGGKLVGGLADQPIKATGTAGDVTVLESPVDGLTVVPETGLTMLKLGSDDAAGALAAQNLRDSALTIRVGTVNASVVTPTASQFEADGFDVAVANDDDHFRDAGLIFFERTDSPTMSLVGQPRGILGSTVQNGRILFTITAATDAPADGDTFVVIG